MKLSKSLLQVLLVAITAGSISSCKKPTTEELKKKETLQTNTSNTPGNCPACGMG